MDTFGVKPRSPARTSANTDGAQTEANPSAAQAIKSQRPRLLSPRILSHSPSRVDARRNTRTQEPAPEYSGGPSDRQGQNTIQYSPPPALLGGAYGVGFRISARAPHVVEKVNEIMDEHDRVLVGSVSCGDELLAINNQLVQHMTPQQVKDCMLGPFSSIAEFTFRPKSSSQSPNIIRAKRHLPIHVWRNWALEEGRAEVGVSGNAVSPSKVSSEAPDLHSFQNRSPGSLHSQEHGHNVRQTNGRVRGQNEEKAEGENDPVATMGKIFSDYESPSQIAQLSERDLSAKEFDAVGGDADDNDDDVDVLPSDTSMCSISAASSQANSIRSSSGSPAPLGTMDQIDHEKESDFVDGNRQARHIVALPGSRTLDTNTNSPKLEIKRCLYTQIHDAMQHARTAGNIDLHIMINKVEQQVRIFESSLVKSNTQSKQTIVRLENLIEEKQRQIENMQASGDVQHRKQLERLTSENMDNMELRHVLQSCLGDGVNEISDIPKYLKSLKEQLERVRTERNKARKEKDELREQLSIHGPVRTRFEELILAVRRLAEERDRMLADHADERKKHLEEVHLLRMANETYRSELDTVRKTTTNFEEHLSLSRQREDNVQQELKTVRERELALAKEIAGLHENEMVMKRLHQDDLERLQAQLSLAQSATSQDNVAQLKEELLRLKEESIFMESLKGELSGLKSKCAQYEEAVQKYENDMHQMKNHFEREMRELEKEVKRQGKGSAEKNEVVRLRNEVQLLENKCARYQKETKQLKFYMSTLPFPEEIPRMPRGNIGNAEEHSNR